MIDTEYHNSTANDDQLSFLQLKQRLNKARKNAKNSIGSVTWNLPENWTD